MCFLNGVNTFYKTQQQLNIDNILINKGIKIEIKKYLM